MTQQEEAFVQSPKSWVWFSEIHDGRKEIKASCLIVSTCVCDLCVYPIPHTKCINTCILKINIKKLKYKN